MLHHREEHHVKMETDIGVMYYSYKPVITKESEGQQKLEEARKDPLLVSRALQACLQLGLDVRPSEPWKNDSLWFGATESLVICYSSHKKRAHRQLLFLYPFSIFSSNWNTNP